MIYLALMVIVAAIGMGMLWLHQRRQHAHGDTVEGFNEALRAISPEAAPGPFQGARVPARRPTRAVTRSRGRSAPLDPKRRAAARRRLEQRRRHEARRRAHASRTR